MTVVRVALAQLNPTVGDLDGNVAKLIEAYDRADAVGCDLVAFPELAITGYPPEDLVLKPGFVVDNRAALERSRPTPATAPRSSASSTPTATSTTLPRCATAARSSAPIASACSELRRVRRGRTFTPGADDEPVALYVIGGAKVGISICEDIWSPFGPLAVQAAGGAELSVNINGSPYHWEKGAAASAWSRRAPKTPTPIVYVNQVGGQDELVFDGGSFVVDAEGTLVARAPQFVEDLMSSTSRSPRSIATACSTRVASAPTPSCRTSRRDRRRPAGPLASAPIAEPLPSDDELYQALVLGTRDYSRKNRFTDVVIGLSGGIDSSSSR